MIKLGSLFSDGAVLQRNKPITVWGETVPDRLVRAEIAGQEGYARSSGSGEFLLTLPPLEAGGPFDLTVSVSGVPEGSVVIRDVMLGEVWLCSGQSNMAYCLGSSWAPYPPEDSSEQLCRKQEKEFLDTVCPSSAEIRFITVPKKVTGCREKYFEGSWRPMTRENAPEASAVAAWFGAGLREKLKVPIGLICCAWGGSDVETWTSPAALRTNPDTRSRLEEWESLRRKKETWSAKAVGVDRLIRRYARPDRGNRGVEQGWAAPGLDDSAWRNMTIPGSWIEQKVSGNGAVWVRRKVTVPAELAGRELRVRTGGIDKHDIAYFNGVEIGRTGEGLDTRFWDRPRCYKVPGELVRPGENTIAIRAFSFILDGGFWIPAKAYRLEGDGWSVSLAGDWKVKPEYDLGKITLPPTPPGIGNHNTPGLQFDSMIRPLLPFTIRGVVWYQGENNAASLAAARTYRRKLETMIRDWRFHWELPELPFLLVQLADYRDPTPYDASSAWAELRHAQGTVRRTLPRVFMATALDTGEEDDIHPQNKKEVGLRLTALALHHVYHKLDVLPCGPVFREARREKNALRVFFQFADALEIRGAPGKSFYLAGADRKFYPADRAEIDGDSILLSSEKVEEPLFVRYAWSDNPENILRNRRFPAAAFGSE